MLSGWNVCQCRADIIRHSRHRYSRLGMGEGAEGEVLPAAAPKAVRRELKPRFEAGGRQQRLCQVLKVATRQRLFCGAHGRPQLPEEVGAGLPRPQLLRDGDPRKWRVLRQHRARICKCHPDLWYPSLCAYLSPEPGAVRIIIWQDRHNYRWSITCELQQWHSSSASWMCVDLFA